MADKTAIIVFFLALLSKELTWPFVFSYRSTVTPWILSQPLEPRSHAPDKIKGRGAALIRYERASKVNGMVFW